MKHEHTPKQSKAQLRQNNTHTHSIKGRNKQVVAICNRKFEKKKKKVGIGTRILTAAFGIWHWQIMQRDRQWGATHVIRFLICLFVFQLIVEQRTNVAKLVGKSVSLCIAESTDQMVTIADENEDGKRASSFLFCFALRIQKSWMLSLSLSLSLSCIDVSVALAFSLHPPTYSC